MGFEAVSHRDPFPACVDNSVWSRIGLVNCVGLEFRVRDAVPSLARKMRALAGSICCGNSKVFRLLYVCASDLPTMPVGSAFWGTSLGCQIATNAHWHDLQFTQNEILLTPLEHPQLWQVYIYMLALDMGLAGVASFSFDLGRDGEYHAVCTPA